MLGDIKNAKLIIFKGFLFLLAGALAALGVWLETPEWRTALLFGIAIWCFGRFYYFAFYVIEKYVDPSYKFAGLGSFVLYFYKKRHPRLPEECSCPCHQGQVVLHPVACCAPCPVCGKQISTASQASHMKKQHPDMTA